MKIIDCISKAEEIRREYNPSNLSPFPYINVEKKETNLKIYITPYPEDNADVSGATLYDKDSQLFTISINKNKAETRQHFTLAHELGHYFLHKDILREDEIIVDEDGSLDNNRMLFRRDDAEYSRIETEANNFAASLIMPKVLVESAWEKLGNVEECANIFNVSVSAMSIRLEKLKLLP